MKIEKQLKKLQKDYLKIAPTPDLQELGWLALKKAIEEDEKRKRVWMPVFARSLVFAMIILLVLSCASVGLAEVSQKSVKGDPLFSFKQFADNFAVNVLGDKQLIKQPSEGLQATPLPSASVTKEDPKPENNSQNTPDQTTKTNNPDNGNNSIKNSDDKNKNVDQTLNSINKEQDKENNSKEDNKVKQNNEVKNSPNVNNNEIQKDIKETKKELDKSLSLPTL